MKERPNILPVNDAARTSFGEGNVSIEKRS
jgi:hypothetical protein